jgi:cytochrome b subunit of formate dehydrogenase
MVVVSLFHFASLLGSRQLREHWKQLLPKPRDATEALLNFAYNLGLCSQRPKLSSHGYVEKAEYWAVVWGTLVMAVTGAVLWANNLALRYLPKEWLDFATTVHFYEAVLATLAIVVWHLYTVIFDPDVYPVDTAWLNGFSVRRRESHDVDPKAQHGGTDTSADKW